MSQTAYTEPMSVYMRFGERAEARIGIVHADQRGRLNPEEVAQFLTSAGEYLQSLVDTEREKVGMSHANAE